MHFNLYVLNIIKQEKYKCNKNIRKLIGIKCSLKK